MIKHIYYKNRQSYENQRGCFRTNFNQIRYDKNSKFSRVSTKHFNSLIEEMKFYSDKEYICAGLNSHEREVVIIDCDSDDFGAKTFSLLKRYNIIPHFIKTKSNGHSQFFFFIEKYYISKGWFDGPETNRKYHEDYYKDNHLKWKRLIKMMNVLFNGDIGFTGYNCQNPFCNRADVIIAKPLNELYTVDFLTSRINHILNTDGATEYVNNAITEYYQNRKKKSLQKSKDKIMIHFTDEERAALDEIESCEELKQKLSEIYEQRKLSGKSISAEEMINEIINLQDNSINKRIFVLTSQVCKSFWQKRCLHDPEYFDEIVYTCIKNWKYQDNAEGYTFQELLARIKYDIYEIKQKDLHNTMLWDKVGYTKIQREKSLKIRRNKMNSKRKRIYKLLNKKSFLYSNMSFNAISNSLVTEYQKIYGQTISLNTVKKYLMIKFKNNVLYLKKYLNKQENQEFKNKSYIHNNNLVNDTDYDIVKCLFIPDKIKLRHKYG